MKKARDLIKTAMKKIGVLAVGENPSAEEMQDGLSALNSMLETFSNDNLLIYESIREEIPLLAGKGSYTIGPTGDLVTSRPMELLIVHSLDPNGLELPIDILTLEQFEEIRLKGLQSSLANYVYLEPAYPNARLTVWPVPSADTKLILISSKPLTGFTTINSDVSLPPGYEDLIVYNLAIRIAPEYGRSITPEVADVARSSKSAVMSTNLKPTFLSSDAANIAGATCRSGWANIYGGGRR